MCTLFVVCLFAKLLILMKIYEGFHCSEWSLFGVGSLSKCSGKKINQLFSSLCFWSHVFDGSSCSALLNRSNSWHGVALSLSWRWQVSSEMVSSWQTETHSVTQADQKSHTHMHAHTQGLGKGGYRYIDPLNATKASWELEPITADIGWEVGCTLDMTIWKSINVYLLLFNQEVP